MKQVVFLMVVLLFPILAAQAAFVVEPSEIAGGGVATVCWDGDDAPRFKVSVAEHVMPAIRLDNRDCALVGIDYAAPAGLVTIAVDVAPGAGEGEDAEPEDGMRVLLPLTVTTIDRPAEFLKLPAQMANPTAPKILKRIEKERQRLDRLFAGVSPIRFSAPFLTPVDGRVESLFGQRRVLNGVEKSAHNGVDYKAPAGARVKAMAAGRVALAGDLYYTGHTVIIDHGGALYSLYAHLDRIQVKEGAAVKPGTVVGTVGSTGRSTGPHLHFSTRLGKARIDPQALLELFRDSR